MGKHFGNLQVLKGVTYYVLSPMELRPFLMMIKPGFENAIRRIIDAATPAIMPLSSGYLLYSWATTEFKKSKRKNPDDFKDEV